MLRNQIEHSPIHNLLTQRDIMHDLLTDITTQAIRRTDHLTITNGAGQTEYVQDTYARIPVHLLDLITEIIGDAS